MPSITLSEDTLSALEKLAQPFVDTTPEHVIQRLLKRADDDSSRQSMFGGSQGPSVSVKGTLSAPSKPRRTRISSDKKVTQAEYRQPILEALAEMGGRGTREEVLQRVGERMEHRLTDEDKQPLPVSPELRWKKSASWERMQMVNEGLLDNGSPRSVWELSEAGWAEARK